MDNEIVAFKEWMHFCNGGSYSSCANPPTGGWFVTTVNDPGKLWFNLILDYRQQRLNSYHNLFQPNDILRGLVLDI